MPCVGCRASAGGAPSPSIAAQPAAAPLLHLHLQSLPPPPLLLRCFRCCCGPPTAQWHPHLYQPQQHRQPPDHQQSRHRGRRAADAAGVLAQGWYARSVAVGVDPSGSPSERAIIARVPAATVVSMSNTVLLPLPTQLSVAPSRTTTNSNAAPIARGYTPYHSRAPPTTTSPPACRSTRSPPSSAPLSSLAHVASHLHPVPSPH